MTKENAICGKSGRWSIMCFQIGKRWGEKRLKTLRNILER